MIQKYPMRLKTGPVKFHNFIVYRFSLPTLKELD